MMFFFLFIKMLNVVFFMLMTMPITQIPMSNSWTIMWLILELNAMSFIMVNFITTEKFYKTEPFLNYFLIQSMASSMFIFSFLIKNLMEKNEFSSMLEKYSSYLMLMSMMIKLGMVPFFSWMMFISKFLKSSQMMMFLSIQKIPPMLIIFKIKPSIQAMIFIMASLTMSSVMQMNIFYIKNILILSSISHLSWMIMSVYSSNSLMYVYFLIYILILIPMVYMVKEELEGSIKNVKLKKNMLLFMFMMMSISGIPPLMGFFPKWMILNSNINNNFSIMMLVLIVTLSSLNFFIYIRIQMKMSLMKYLVEKNKKNYKKNWVKNLMIMNIMMPCIIYLT